MYSFVFILISIFYFLLIYCFCLVTNVSDYNEENLFWVLILNNCIKEKNKATTVGGNWTNKQSKNLQSILHSYAINLVGPESSDYSETINTRRTYKIEPSHKLFKAEPSRNFLFVDYNLFTLRQLLNTLRHSIWWNVDGFFFIVNTATNDTCIKALEYLNATWAFDVLTAIYLCKNAYGNNKLYTFNPLADYAPSPWSQAGLYRQNNGHPFFLFEMPSNTKNLSQICNSLNFDKTKNLGGYPIRIVGSKSYHPIDHRKIITISGYEGTFSEMVWTRLNATIIFSIRPYEKMGNLDKYGFPMDTLKDIFNGKYDVSMNFRIDDMYFKNQIYLNREISVCSISRKHLFSLNKRVLKLFTLSFTSLSIIAFLGTTVIFMLLGGKKSFLQTSLHLFRILLGFPVSIPVMFTISKAIFIVILFLSMIANSYLQSKFFSAVTAPQYDIVTSDQDLINKNYQILSREYIRDRYYSESVLYNRTKVITNNNEFLNSVKTNDKIALITACPPINHNLVCDNSLHVTELNNLGKLYNVYTHRNNFFLHKRLYRLFPKLQDAGILLFEIEQEVGKGRFMKISSEPTSHNLLNAIDFGYLLWTRGVLTSVLIFFLELIIFASTIIFPKLLLKIHTYIDIIWN